MDHYTVIFLKWAWQSITYVIAGHNYKLLEKAPWQWCL